MFVPENMSRRASDTRKGSDSVATKSAKKQDSLQQLRTDIEAFLVEVNDRMTSCSLSPIFPHELIVHDSKLEPTILSSSLHGDLSADILEGKSLDKHNNNGRISDYV